MMGGLAAGGGGGMMQIEVTPEDEEAIGRLMALGFPRGAAIQVITLAPTQLYPNPSPNPDPNPNPNPNPEPGLHGVRQLTLSLTLTLTLAQAFMACDKDENLAANFLFDQGNDLE